jgi:hypothetical protein
MSNILFNEKEARRFSLDKFIRFYIDIFLEASENNMNLLDFEFYSLSKIKTKFDIKNTSVEYLNHPFYWYFYRADSPLEFIDKVDKNVFIKYKDIIYQESDIKSQSIALSRLYKESVFINRRIEFELDKEKIFDFIYNKYKNYFSSRLNNLEINGGI